MKKTTFWSEDPDDENLIEQVIRGFKTATAYPKVWYYRTPGEEPTQVGDFVAVYNSKGIHRCTIEITEVYEIPLGSVNNKIIRGENFSTREEFIGFLDYCYGRTLREQGYDFNEDTILVVEHFRLVSVIE